MTVIMELRYKDEVTDIMYNSIVKIYPTNFSNIVGDKDDYLPYLNSQNKKTRLDNYMDFLFMREGLIGCWIKNTLLLPQISPTFACIYDSYKMRGLLIDKDKFINTVHADQMSRNNKFDKNWITDILDTHKYPNYWETKIMTSHFGFIEMEKLDDSLENIINAGTEFDLDIIFEILYSKLVLMFYGNVYILDDHARNIMTRRTDVVRHYEITRRKTIYNFYVSNPNMVKFIDFERFSKVTNRNLFVDHPNDNDKFIRIFNSSYYRSFSSLELSIADYMFKELKNPAKATVNNFCELMIRCLPERFTNRDLYVGRQIEKYSINLDLDEASIQNNFLSEMIDTKNIDVPFEFATKDEDEDKHKDTELLEGGFYYKKYEKYMIKNMI
jgi:hypothetical protein